MLYWEGAAFGVRNHYDRPEDRPQLLSMLLSSLTYLSLDLKEGSDGGEHQEAGYGHHSNVCPQHSILEHHRHCSQLSHQR